MFKAIEIPNGTRFHFLTVLNKASERNRSREVLFNCQCDCGKRLLVSGCELRHGRTKACAPIRSEPVHGNARTPEYKSYTQAKARCSKPDKDNYHRYGGRGIEFRFESFVEFVTEVGLKPSPTHTLDRIDTNGHYEKGNVKWSTPKEQSRNTSANLLLTAFGKTQCAAEWMDEYRMSSTLLYDRIRRGWCPECALTIPLNTAQTHRLSCPHRNVSGTDAKFTDGTTVKVSQETGIIEF